ncbi:2-dehydro-3-deoxygalactonokinase [Lichenihabitans psoromatis]|uniref:2-dehydro-3-deoxygalactonokinase n=1 Tax=Lichenihabitans psoromatis TaxID=2528642 RepID=UPI001035C269|nr:2-dehydro-3-deoxygalactonokinase [Lichenihabitans psoromatis]
MSEIDKPALIAVDWGTTRMRASLVGQDGAVLDRITSDQGVQSIAAGGFPAALEAACGPWFATDPHLRVVMSGMVGSRNGWVEAPYVSCPCGPDDLAAGFTRIEGARDVVVAPGVDIRWPDGAYDVMRGEEVQAIGVGLADGMICLPGTHSKWIEMAGGRIVRFATFVTGELYAAIAGSFLGRLAEAPDDASGHVAGARAARFKGGLSRSLFQTRSQVLGGDIDGHAVRPFLSSLVIGQELIGAQDLFGPCRSVHLVAASPQREVYQAAFEQHGIAVTTLDPAEVTLSGLRRLYAASKPTP